MKENQLLKNYYMAISYGDYAEQQEIIAEIGKYNKKVRRNFPKAVITANAVYRCVRAHLRQTITMHNGVAISPMFRHNLIQYADDKLLVLNPD